MFFRFVDFSQLIKTAVDSGPSPFHRVMASRWNVRGGPSLTRKKTGQRHRCNQQGFTLIELMTVIAIIGTLAAFALVNFTAYVEKAKVTAAIVEIKDIERSILVFQLENERLPNTLVEAGLGNPIDPWGNPYVYYPLSSVPKGKQRKDKSLVPINSDYDLYSSGRDGQSAAPLTAKTSQDDIVRAYDGKFVGIAKNY